MSAPIELRMYMPLYRIEDVHNGLQSIRQKVAPDKWEHYAPGRLQYRFRVKTASGTEWSSWHECKWVREGQEEA